METNTSLSTVENFTTGKIDHSLASGVVMAEAPVLPSESNDGRVAVSLSDCGCGGQGGQCTCKSSPVVERVFALGQLGIDFGSEIPRRDLIKQFLNGTDPTVTNILNYLVPNQAQPVDGPIEDAERLIWTLIAGPDVIYAIWPTGAFGFRGYLKLIAGLRAQISSSVSVIPGVIAGSVTLLSGKHVPVVVPEIRGMMSWAPTHDIVHRLDEHFERMILLLEKTEPRLIN